MTAVSTRARPVSRGLFALAVVGALAGAYLFWLHVTTDPLIDVRAYYNAAARLNAGLPLYQPGIVVSFVYPPLFAVLFRPLALLPFWVAAAIWEGLVVAAFAMTLWRLGIRRPATWLAVGMLGLPIGWVLAIGQAEAAITLLLTLGNPLAVALAGNIKLFPFLIGLYWCGRRDWRDLGRLVGWSAALGLFELVADPADMLDYASAVVTGTQQVALSGNISPFPVSPLLWAILVVAGLVVTLRLAPTRWGWAAAVALSVFASPRLFSYMLMTLLACLRRPDEAPTD
jgi:alpha-1,2-mannosyltransferase